MSDTSSIATWLRDLGLGEHQTLFAENHIDFDVLAELLPELLGLFRTGPS